MSTSTVSEGSIGEEIRTRARVYGLNDALLLPGDVASVLIQVFTPSEPRAVFEAERTASGIVFDALQPWEWDTVGYNVGVSLWPDELDCALEEHSKVRVRVTLRCKSGSNLFQRQLEHTRHITL